MSFRVSGKGAPERLPEDAAWLAELERRAQAVLDGAPTIPWEEIRRATEESLCRELT